MDYVTLTVYKGDRIFSDGIKGYIAKEKEPF